MEQIHLQLQDSPQKVVASTNKDPLVEKQSI